MKEIKEAIKIMRSEPVDILKVQDILEKMKIVNTRHNKVLKDVFVNLKYVNEDICVKEAILSILGMLVEEIEESRGVKDVV